jgi:hypothetical protein
MTAATKERDWRRRRAHLAATGAESIMRLIMQPIARPGLRRGLAFTSVGYLVSSGPVSARLGFAGLGVLAGWILIWFVVLVINVVRGTGSALGRTT